MFTTSDRFHKCWGGMEQNIEIGLSIYALCLRPTFEMLFTGAKVQHKAQKIGVGHKKQFMKLTPDPQCINIFQI